MEFYFNIVGALPNQNGVVCYSLFLFHNTVLRLFHHHHYYYFYITNYHSAVEIF